MNELLVKENIKIEDMIYEVRGKQVILDSDIAFLFAYETFNLNKSVKRNIEKFDEEYMFQLSNAEYENLIFQNGISKKSHGGRRTLPYVFTEKGVLMLATILKSKTAIDMSIKIINTFVLMRHYISNDLISKTIEYKLLNHDKRISLLEKTFNNFKEQNSHMFFEGQIYDAYSLMLDILNKSKSSIIIIDNYVDKNILDILSKTNKNVTIITNKYDNEDYSKYKKQYSNIKLIINNNFHDRFIIIDKKVLYHCGSSFKDLGKKCFAINRIEDNDYLNELLERI